MITDWMELGCFHLRDDVCKGGFASRNIFELVLLWQGNGCMLFFFLFNLFSSGVGACRIAQAEWLRGGRGLGRLVHGFLQLLSSVKDGGGMR